MALENQLTIHQRVNVDLPCNSIISFLGMKPKEWKMYIYTKMWTQIFRGALFTMVKTWKQPKRPSPNEWNACMLSHLSCVWLFATPWTAACQARCPWDPPGKSTAVGSHSLFQGVFPTQGLKLGQLYATVIKKRGDLGFDISEIRKIPFRSQASELIMISILLWPIRTPLNKTNCSLYPSKV